MVNDNRKKRAFDLLERFGEAHGASGCENRVRRMFRDEFIENIHSDKAGNIICKKEGSTESPRLMVAAHMDEIGFMVQSIRNDGLIKFVPLGSWRPNTLLAQRMRILTRKGTEIVGVIGAKAPHMLTEEERKRVVPLDEMCMDVGASSQDEVENHFGIQVGDSIVPDSPFTPLYNPDFLMCKAFDDRVGLALGVQALQEIKEIDHPNSIFCVGTVQEELGARGAQTVANHVNPDAAIVLEGAPADDFLGIPEDERQAVLGKGVQIRLFDPTAIMNRQFVQYVTETAKEANIPHQVAVRKSGGTDAKAIHLSGIGVPTLVLGVPARYIHTHNSIIHIDDYLSTLELLVKLLQRLDSVTVEGFTTFLD